MQRSRAALVSALATASALALGFGFRTHEPGRERPRPMISSLVPVASLRNPGRPRANRPVAPPLPHPARWLAFGGGAEPSSNQVSMENDLALASDVFGGGGILLFAGGPSSQGVYELATEAPKDELALELADLVSPHGGRDARYRKTRLSPHGPATREAIVAALEVELATPGSPLLVYVDCHGDGGVSIQDNSLATWGGNALTVKELTSIFDAAKRPVRLVVSACFSGGLAELAFQGGKPDGGATELDRCGLFASTWDLEATGCDPDPERRNHEGYAVHFLHALRSTDKAGNPLRVDFDGDGEVSLLEAHTQARIASKGLDVPTTTSERWLRAVAPPRGPGAAVALPEEDATIAALTVQLGLLGDAATVEADARRHLDEFETRYAVLAEAESRANQELERARSAVKAELFSQWPVLEDPWHADYSESLALEHDAIDAFFNESQAYADFIRARERVDRASEDALDVSLDRAPMERLVRAIDNRLLAARVKHRGGSDWRHYEKLLRCERSHLPGTR